MSEITRENTREFVDQDKTEGYHTALDIMAFAGAISETLHHVGYADAEVDRAVDALVYDILPEYPADLLQQIGNTVLEARQEFRRLMAQPGIPEEELL